MNGRWRHRPFFYGGAGRNGVFSSKRELFEVVIINQGDDAGFEEELANDVLEIITLFSARLYDSRSHRNQKLIDGVRQAVKEAQ
jgi:predicted site-specific integrase-resolvase